VALCELVSYGEFKAFYLNCSKFHMQARATIAMRSLCDINATYVLIKRCSVQPICWLLYLLVWFLYA